MIQYNNENTWKSIHYNGHSIKSVYVYQANKVWPTIPSVYKWLATYNGGTVTYGECDGSSAITSGEVASPNLVDVKIGDCVTSIGAGAFKACTILSSATISDSVTNIGNYAFNECYELSSVNIPSGLTSINDYTFMRCYSLTSIDIPNGVTSIGRQAFSVCSGLTSIELPDSVTSIGNEAFASCRSLTSVTIGSGLTSINDYAFQYCSALRSLDIPNTVTSIGFTSFKGCSGLTSVTIGSGVTSIDSVAFSGCNSLTSITVNAITPPNISNNTFDDTNNCPIYVPCQSVDAYKADVYWRNYENRITCRKDYKTEYFTVRMLQNNSILSFTKGNRFDYDLQYSLDSGATWNVYESQLYNLSSGSTVMFKGSISSDNHNNDGVGHIYSNYKYEVEGNIMSLLYGDNFSDKTVLQYVRVFMNLFYRNPYLLNIDNLVIPATTLTEGCYLTMFEKCENIVKAPELPATTLTEGCYQGMFRECTNLNEITCRATDISATNCTFEWLKDVSSSGTFKTPSSTSWTTGDSGIPTNWNRVNI